VSGVREKTVASGKIQVKRQNSGDRMLYRGFWNLDFGLIKSRIQDIGIGY
jgi:hypothetical protein